MRRSQILALRKKDPSQLLHVKTSDSLTDCSREQVNFSATPGSGTPTARSITPTTTGAAKLHSVQPTLNPAQPNTNAPLVPLGGGTLSTRPFKAPAGGASLLQSSHLPTPPKTIADFYFRVLYCKRSNKKHKIYDDGYLVVTGKKCVLKDVEEKIITQQMVRVEPSTLGCESTLDIGGYQAEIVDVIKADDYLSGRVFMANRSPPGTLLAPLATHFKKVGTTQPSTRTPLSSSSNVIRSPSTSSSTASSKSSSLRVVREPAIASQPAFQIDQDRIVLNTRFLEGPRKQHPVAVETCIGRYLRPHQVEGVQFMYDCFMGNSSPGYQGCILADPMGLGKSLQAIAITWTLLNSGPRGEPEISKAIFVCPATLVRNWDDEFRKWLGSHVCKPLVLDASAKFAEQEEIVKQFVYSPARNKKEAVLIVGYELIQKHLTLLRQLKSPLIVCDEGHRLKNHSGNKTIKGLSSIPTSRRLLLTGTPVQNNLMEFFAMVDFVNPSFLGSSRAFQNSFATPIAHSRDNQSSGKEQTLGEMRSRELARLTSKFVLRRSGNILKQYLPPKIEAVLFCPLTELQSQLYYALLRSINGVVSPDNQAVALTCIIALKKVCSHPALIAPDCGKCNAKPAPQLPHSQVLGFVGKGSEESAGTDERVAQQAQLLFGEAAKILPADISEAVELSSKLGVLAHILEHVKKNNEKVVVVSSAGKTLNIIQTLCNQRGYQFLRLDGTTKANVRMELVHQFNSSSARWVFLLSARAGGMGLNLVGANRLVLFEPDWNPAVDAQAMGRVWRDGQTRQVFVYRLLSTATIDEKIFQRQIRKQEVAEAVTQDRNEGSRNFSHKNLKELFTYRNQTQCETYDLMKANHQAFELKQKWDFLKPADDDDIVVKSIPSDLVSFMFRWDSRNQVEEHIPDSLEALSAALLGKDSVPEGSNELEDDVCETKEPTRKKPRVEVEDELPEEEQ